MDDKTGLSFKLWVSYPTQYKQTAFIHYVLNPGDINDILASGFNSYFVSCHSYNLPEQYGPYLLWTQLTETHSSQEMVFKWTSGHPTGTRKDEIQWGHNGAHNYKSPRLQYHSHLHGITTHYKTPPQGKTSEYTYKL